MVGTISNCFMIMVTGYLVLRTSGIIRKKFDPKYSWILKEAEWMA